MRAIDADALIKSIDGNPFTTDSVKSYIHASVAKMPTIKPERKKGKWIKTGQSFVFPEKFRNYSCSECGYDVNKTKFNFCPNCGADME